MNMNQEMEMEMEMEMRANLRATRTTWQPARSETWGAGRQGFETYFQHVTKFRPAVSALVDQIGGKPLIRTCDVSHPRTPETIKGVVESSLKQQLSGSLHNQLAEFLRIKEHQPQRAKEAIATVLNQRFERPVSCAEVLILQGSSMQWLDIVFRQAIIKSLHDDFALSGHAKQPIVLAPAGSFKCGGYFPHANGGKLAYIPTSLEHQYKLTADLLEESIQEIEADGSKKVVCFVLETPTALGQNFSRRELAQIAQVLTNYPHILWVQDGYNLGTEHDGILNPSLADCPEIAQQGCTISSFRRDWGGAASYANVSAFHTFNPYLLQAIRQQCSETYFYTHLPFTELQRIATNAIAEEMCSSCFTRESQIYFKEQLTDYTRLVAESNQRINNVLGTWDIQYIYTIQPHAGQFGFLFFDKATTDKSGANSSTKMAELMCLYSECRVMPTLLDPMGIGRDPVGVRLNAVMSSNAEENRQINQEALARVSDLVIEMERGQISYEQIAPFAEKLREGRALTSGEIGSLEPL